jgi:hypothetical protein
MSFIFYLLFGFAIMVGSKIWQQKYFIQLTDEQKVMLVNILKKRNNINLYMSIAAIVLFLLIVLFKLLNLKLAILLLVLVNVLATAIPLNINYNKMVALNLPEKFTNNYLLTSVLRVIGTIVIFSYLLLENPNF